MTDIPTGYDMIMACLEPYKRETRIEELEALKRYYSRAAKLTDTLREKLNKEIENEKGI